MPIIIRSNPLNRHSTMSVMLAINPIATARASLGMCILTKIRNFVTIKFCSLSSKEVGRRSTQGSYRQFFGKDDRRREAGEGNRR
jgi:hypothetical protein